MIDRGSGIPVVLIPGIQGRWEWMAPAVDALAEHCRVITFSLADEPTSGFRFDENEGYASYVAQVREALDRAGIDRAVIVGISFSGLLATEFAARHPDRVLGLVLLSALPPGWAPDARARFYMRAPRLLSPVFFVASPIRMFPELAAALTLRDWPRLVVTLGTNVVRASLSSARMAQRVACMTRFRFSDAATVHAPALVITGEDRLDRVVKPELTRQYLQHLPQAKCVTLASTGHLGLITRPTEFAAIVYRFANDAAANDNSISA